MQTKQDKAGKMRGIVAYQIQLKQKDVQLADCPANCAASKLPAAAVLMLVAAGGLTLAGDVMDGLHLTM